MDKIRFGIVGSGSIAPTHAECIRELADAELAAVMSRSKDKASALARRYGCKVYDDYAAMLKRSDIDAISICTPSGTHAEMVVAAAQAGKHVIVEKPIDVSLEKADAAIDACRAAGVKLAVISQRRWGDGIPRLKAALERNELGKLFYGNCSLKLYRSQEYFDSAAWRGTWSLDGGGVLMNQGIHYIDLLQYLMGPVSEVSAECRTVGHERIEVEDLAAARLRFANGALGIIEATTNAYPGLSSRIDIYGELGTAIVENDVLARLCRKDGEDYVNQAGTEGAGVSSPAVSYDNHKRQFEQLIQAIRTGGEPVIDGREGRKPLEIILAVYKSAYTKQPVSLPLENSRFMTDLARESLTRNGFNF